MSRQSRPVIPPSRHIGKSPTTQALTLLQKKLNTAEAETASLVRQLADFGFSADSKPLGKNEKDSTDPVAPFLPVTADAEVLHKHYEALVARLCRTESQLQTLKLNLCALQAERDLTRERSAAASSHDESVAQLKEEHEDELRRLNKELARTRTEWKETLEQRNEMAEEVRRLSSALEAATTAKSELAVAYEDLISIRQKLKQRNAELREELAREGSLRMTLEDSHSVLLARVREMEEVVESERQEVQILSVDCLELRQEGVRIQEEKRHYITQQARLEETITRLIKGDVGAKQIQLAEAQEENKVLLATLKGVKRENVALRNEMQNSRIASESTETKVLQFEEERNALYSALTQALSANASPSSLQRITKFSSEPSSVAVQVKDTLQGLVAERINLHSQLADERQKSGSADQLSSELQANLQAAQERFGVETREHQSRVQSLENSIEQLNRELASLQDNNQGALQVKEHLLQEVNLAVDGMSEETGKLHQELAQAKLEITSLGQDKQYLTEENRRLMERISAVEQQQDTHQKVQSTMADLLESKNRLAYDKGRLQSRVDQLQRELESLAGARTNGLQLEKTNAAMQTQYSKATSELSSVKVTVHRLESKLRQEQDLSSRKEKDFTLAIQARDEAFQECQRLKGQLQVMEDREKQKGVSFQRSLADAKTDQAKIAATLQGVMASHKQLQTAVENLQTELGRKDSELSSLRSERQSRQNAVESLQREVRKLTTNLVTMETLEGTQLESLRSELDRALAEKTKLGNNMDDLLQANGKLHATVQRVQNQLEKRNHKYKLLQETREKEAASLQDQLKASEDRLQSTIAARKEASIKNASKELGHLQRTNQDLTSRIKDLSQANADLHGKAASLEETCSKQRDRIRGQKSQLENCTRLRKTNTEMAERIKDISRQLSEMESAKREYARKNSEQAKTISNFVQQVAGLQADLQAISSTQASFSKSSRKKDHQLEKQRGEMQCRAKELREAVDRLEEEKKEVENKLLEASNESVQITANLQEAHSWFKVRHDALQQELIEARQRQSQLEKTNTDQQQQLLQERMKAAEQAQRSRNMIRASQQAVSHLARQAEANHRKTKSEMTTIARRLQAEKDHSTYTDNKLQKFMDISSQYIEELAMELDQHREGLDDITTAT